jgi:hypothetical protein
MRKGEITNKGSIDVFLNVGVVKRWKEIEINEITVKR